VKKTVFGLSDSMTKFTSSVGKGTQRAGLNWIFDDVLQGYLQQLLILSIRLNVE